MMPGMNGHDLAKELAQTQRDMRCLFISGYADVIAARQEIVDAEVHFLPKPFTRDVLAKEVRRALAAR